MDEKAYPEAYDEAWDKIVEEIDDKYADAEEKYELNDPDFTEVPVKVYENFFRNEEEDYNNDGEAEGNIRVYAKNDNVDLACLLDGAFPEKRMRSQLTVCMQTMSASKWEMRFLSAGRGSKLSD